MYHIISPAKAIWSMDKRENDFFANTNTNNNTNNNSNTLTENAFTGDVHQNENSVPQSTSYYQQLFKVDFSDCKDYKPEPEYCSYYSPYMEESNITSSAAVSTTTMSSLKVPFGSYYSNNLNIMTTSDVSVKSSLQTSHLMPSMVTTQSCLPLSSSIPSACSSQGRRKLVRRKFDNCCFTGGNSNIIAAAGDKENLSIKGVSLCPSSASSALVGFPTLLEKFYVPPAKNFTPINAPFDKIANIGGNSAETRRYVPNPKPGYPNRGTRCNELWVEYKFGEMGIEALNLPNGFALGFDNDILICDTDNDRIVSVSLNGAFRQEWTDFCKPRKIAVSADCFFVCDAGCSKRIRLLMISINGKFQCEINIRFIDVVSSMLVDNEGNLHILEGVNPHIHIVPRLEKAVQRKINIGDYVHEASDFVIFEKNYYITDFKGHCVCIFDVSGTFVKRFGGDSCTIFPFGIETTSLGDILVADSHGNKLHVAAFNKDGILFGEFESTNCKLSRCCGFALTPSGCPITLSRANNQLLIMKSIFAPQITIGNSTVGGTAASTTDNSNTSSPTLEAAAAQENLFF